MTALAERTDGRTRAICGICPAACWIEVKLENGKITETRKDETHPLGMICRRGLRAPDIVYSEDRVTTPLRRVGKKGTHDFEPISWDEAYDAIVENLERIKRESGPEATAIYTGRGAFELSLCDMYQPKEAAVSSASNVLFPFGSPNTMGVGALCYVSFAMIAPHTTMGRMLVDMFQDIENADTLVVWGANPATDSPPLDMRRLEAAAERGAKIFVIDPRHTETAKRVGAEWIPIRPGTDGALALSLIETIVEEDLYDEEFAEKWCRGFDDLRRYTQHFRPEQTEPITGVKAETVRRLARAVATSGGACPVMYTGLEYSNSGVQAIRAALTFFALAGQLDVPGGIGLAPLGSQFPINRSCNQTNPNLAKAAARDKFPIYSAYRGESHATGLLDATLKGEPYPIRALIIHGASMLTSWPQTSVWREAFEKLDFVATIDRKLTADAAYADIVLPATTMFEIDSYTVYGPIFRLREKVIEPVGQARNDYLIMAELAERLGYGELYPQSEEALLRFALEGSGFSLEDVREAGGVVKIDQPAVEYRKWEKGGLRPDGEPGFDTPSGKFEIASTILEDYGYEPLPKYTEPLEGPLAAPELAKSYPLVFNSGARNHSKFRSQFHEIASLNRDDPEPTVEIAAKDAAKRDIRTGDLTLVKTPRGAVPFRAVVSEDIAPGSIECEMGAGGPTGTKPWREWNVNELTDVENLDEISGFPIYKALLCEVEKIEEGGDDERETFARIDRLRINDEARVEKKVERKVYLDNNATTRVALEVVEAMTPFLAEEFGNPSSVHSRGASAKSALEAARRSVARLIGARPKSIYFTGGGSEADNLALKGAAFALREKGAHIVTTTIEHPAVLNAARFLESIGFEVVYLPSDADGTISPADFRDALRDDTVLASVMTANNEVGTIQPIAELAAIARERGVLFHTDAVQAIGKIPVSVEELGVDILSLSAHKFHGPKGVGALYVRKGVGLTPLIHGGKQEVGVRAGTENIPGIVGLGKAAELAVGSLDAADRVRALRDRLEEGIRSVLPEARLNGSRERRLPNTLNLSLPDLRGESAVVALDQRGIALSSGSACKAGSPEPTHVLMAMGRTEEEAHRSVRFSLSEETSEEDVDYVVESLRRALDELENTVRFLSCK